MILTAENLAFGYNGRRLFSDISVTLTPGRLYSLAGPNGCGKSTLLKIMCNYLKPQNGCVKLDGKAIEEYSSAERSRRMGVVWQSTDPGLDFSVQEMVQIISSARFPRLGNITASDKQLIYSNLERFGLLEKRQQLFSTLSGGEKQQLVLAAAATLEPDILLLDEPASALDPANRNLVYNFLAEYAKDHTVLAITHDLAMPCRSGGMLLLLDKAGNFYSGEAEKLLNSELLSKIYNTPTTVETTSTGKKRVFFD